MAKLPKSTQKRLRQHQLEAIRKRDQSGYVHRERPSRVWQTMWRVHEADRQQRPAANFTGEWQRAEFWENDLYYAMADFFMDGFFLDDSPYVIIGISSIDETARHDFRDFQRIKNDIAGEEWEGIELYPAESRLVDPSNRFFLWCVPKGVLQFGMPDRIVKTYERGAPPQRPFP